MGQSEQEAIFCCCDACDGTLVFVSLLIALIWAVQAAWVMDTLTIAASRQSLPYRLWVPVGCTLP